jgi:ABC-type dipeptide/oligopeptide/nickel transport system permease subunit
MGTDDLGRDMLARMLYGGRISLAVGLAAMLMAMTVGVSSAPSPAWRAAGSTRR